MKRRDEIDDNELSAFYDKARIFFKNAILKLLNTLPLKSNLLADLQVVHPMATKSSASSEAVRRLAVTIKMFPRDKIDLAVNEYKLFRFEELPTDWNLIELYDSSSCLDDDSDKEAETVGLSRVDEFWAKVETVKSLTGEPKFGNLVLLMKMCLTLSHGQASVERSFSENKLVVTNLRNRLGDATLNGLRITSSFVRRLNGRPEELPLTPTLIKSVKSYRTTYYNRQRAARQTNEQAIEIEVVPGLPSASTSTNNQDVAARKRQEGMQDEAMKLLEDGIKAGDMTKVNAAHILLQKCKEQAVPAKKTKKD